MERARVAELGRERPRPPGEPLDHQELLRL